MICKQCGKELPQNFTTDICLYCSRENVRKIFKEHPEVKQAFKESVEEMKKPENMKKMSDDICNFMARMQAITKMNPEERASLLMTRYQQEPVVKNPCWIYSEKGILKECIHEDRGFDCRECERMK